MSPGRRHYKFVVEDWDRHGNARVYPRQQGKPKIRLREEPATPEFDAEYRLAMRENQTCSREAAVACERHLPRTLRGLLRLG